MSFGVQRCSTGFGVKRRSSLFGAQRCGCVVCSYFTSLPGNVYFSTAFNVSGVSSIAFPTYAGNFYLHTYGGCDYYSPGSCHVDCNTPGHPTGGPASVSTSGLSLDTNNGVWRFDLDITLFFGDGLNLTGTYFNSNPVTSGPTGTYNLVSVRVNTVNAPCVVFPSSITFF